MDAKYKNKGGNNKGFDRRKKDFSTVKEEVSECVVSGRNAVRELLVGERDIDKLYVQSGEREGSIKLLVATAIEANDLHRLQKYGIDIKIRCSRSSLR